MRRVVVETPYAGNIEANLEYLRRCLHDCFLRGEAPFASHALYTQPGVLDDDKPDERRLGIEAGFVWGEAAEATVVYTDRGLSEGVKAGIAAAERAGRPIEFRTLSRRSP